MGLKSRKIVLVGDNDSGKSSLLSVYVRNKFPKNYEPTVCETMNVDVEDPEAGKGVHLELWDTSGSPEQAPLRNLCYADADCVVVCFSVGASASLKNVAPVWAAEVRRACGSVVPLLLVANKVDVRRGSRPDLSWSRADGLRVAKSIGVFAYIECSALLREGVKEVFETAVKAALDFRPIDKHPKCVMQ